MSSDVTFPELVLGWRVTKTLDPRYWVHRNARCGGHAPGDLVTLAAPMMAAHTAIIAQSGSGKSVLVGRIVEELMLKTKARCIVLDPNADFRRVTEVEHDTLWTEAAYDLGKRRGKLPHESDREEFAAEWKNVEIWIKRGRSEANPHEKHQQLQLWWPLLSPEFLGDDLTAQFRSGVYHCHAFVYALSVLAEAKTTIKPKSIDLIKLARTFLTHARGFEEAGFRAELIKEFGSIKGKENLLPFWWPSPEHLMDSMVAASEFIEEDVAKYYFGKIREIEATGILQTSTVPGRPHSGLPSRRLEVVDLPSLKDKSTRLLAINALLTAEWERAREAWNVAMDAPESDDRRVPTFIVVDEAHNLIPHEPRNKAETALREQFRTLVAEGRKYGLFIVLVSQRPDKLDSLIVSECENKAVMRLASASVLQVTRTMLGLDDVSPRVLEKCLEFETGRALLLGRWAPEGPVLMYCAPRRTVEGGRNLREDHWARLPSRAAAPDAPEEGLTSAQPSAVTVATPKRRRLSRR
jgi:hypothetical protein